MVMMVVHRLARSPRRSLPHVKSQRNLHGSKSSEEKSIFEHIMEYRMPVSLGVTCLVCVELRRVVKGAHKQEDVQQQEPSQHQ